MSRKYKFFMSQSNPMEVKGTLVFDFLSVAVCKMFTSLLDNIMTMKLYQLYSISKNSENNSKMAYIIH